MKRRIQLIFRFTIVLLSAAILSAALLSCSVLGISDDAERDIAILMYHDFTEKNEDKPFTVSAGRFDEQLSALEKAGYKAVFFSEVIDFVQNGGELPEKCVIITSDDGYLSVIDTALPICVRHEMKLSCAIIGGKVDMETHFLPDPSLSGILEITSHSFMLHDGCGGEAELREDIAEMNKRYAKDFPMVSKVFTYPHGERFDGEEDILLSEGFLVTITTETGVAHIVRGSTSSLLKLPRIPVYENTSGENLVRLLR